MKKAASDDNDLWFVLEAWMCTPSGILGGCFSPPLQENQSCLNKQIRDGKSEKQGLRGEKKGGYFFLFATLLHVLFACGFLFLFSH